MQRQVEFVYELMTRHPVTLSADDPLSVARDVMRLGRIRHVPIVDDSGKIEGILSDRDLGCGALLRACGIDVRMERHALARITAREVMAHRISTTTPQASLADAARQMNERKISCLPVIENEIVVGVLTAHDFVLALIDPSAKFESEVVGEALKGDPSDWQSLEDEYQRLRTIRDELRVQIQLATMEVRDGFEQAELRWAELERHLAEHAKESDESLDDAARIGRNFVKETRILYDELRQKLGRH